MVLNHHESIEEKLAKAEARADEAEAKVKELEKKKDSEEHHENENEFSPPPSAPKIDPPEPDIDDEYELEDWLEE